MNRLAATEPDPVLTGHRPDAAWGSQRPQVTRAERIAPRVGFGLVLTPVPATSPTGDIAAARDLPRHRMVTLVVAALAFPVLPLELGLGRIPLGPLLALALVGISIRHYGGLGKLDSRVLWTASLLAAWGVVRLLVIAPLRGEGIALDMMSRDLTGLVAGLLAAKLATTEEFRPAIFRGMFWCFALLVGIEAYQLAVGLGPLVARGYTAESGFNYYTLAGGYRPFGTFTGPTTFGTFLAMVGLWSAFSLSRRLGTTVGIITVVMVAATDTRAAFVAIVAALATAVATSPELRRKSAGLLIFGPILLAIAVITNRNAFAHIVARATSATMATDTSRSARTTLWKGVIDAVSVQNATPYGLGGQDWFTTMGAQVGDLAMLGHPHSNFFQEWYRYGLIGAGLFALLLITLLASTIRGVRARGRYGIGALCGVATFAADSVFNNSLSSLNFLLVVFLLAGTGAVDCESRIGNGRQADILYDLRQPAKRPRLHLPSDQGRPRRAVHGSTGRRRMRGARKSKPTSMWTTEGGLH